MKTIRVGPGTKLIDVLASATVAPVLLEQNGHVYQVFQVTSPQDPFKDYDPGAAKAALKRAAAALAGVDAEALKARLLHEREQAHRPYP